MQHNNKQTIFTTQPSLTCDSTNHNASQNILSYYYKGVIQLIPMMVRRLTPGQNLRKLTLQREIKARRVRILEFKGYNSKIVSADKAEREKDLKLDQFYLGFRPTVDTALIPLCNTRFIKGHKPSNHIRARIKSHVYRTE